MTKDFDSKLKALKTKVEDDVKDVKSNLNSANRRVIRLEETTLATLKEEIGDETDFLTEKVKRLESKTQNYDQCTNERVGEDSKRRFIVRNLAERDNENVKGRVNNLISNGLKLDVRVDGAVRKESRTRSKPRIIVVTCKSESDKESIIKMKKDLRHSRRYADVFIEYDVPLHQRKLNKNFRDIVNTLGQDKLYFKGNRVLYTETYNRESERNDRDHYRPCQQDNDERYNRREQERYHQSPRRQSYSSSYHRHDYMYSCRD